MIESCVKKKKKKKKKKKLGQKLPNIIFIINFLTPFTEYKFVTTKKNFMNAKQRSGWLRLNQRVSLFTFL